MTDPVLTVPAGRKRCPRCDGRGTKDGVAPEDLGLFGPDSLCGLCHGTQTVPDDHAQYVAVLADCHGPNLNGDAYTPEALAQLQHSLRVLLAARGPLPVQLNFSERRVGWLDEVALAAEQGELRGTARIDLDEVHKAMPQLPDTPELALAVRTDYTQCSDCGKPLYSTSDSPCAGAHHVIGAGAVAGVDGVSVVEHSAFSRPPEMDTAEVELQNQPDDWPYPERYTDDGSEE